MRLVTGTSAVGVDERWDCCDNSSVVVIDVKQASSRIRKNKDCMCVVPPPRLISIISAGFTRIGSTTAIRAARPGEQIAMASSASRKSSCHSRGWKAALKVALVLVALGRLRRKLPKFKKWASSPHPRNCAAADQ